MENNNNFTHSDTWLHWASSIGVLWLYCGLLALLLPHIAKRWDTVRIVDYVLRCVHRFIINIDANAFFFRCSVVGRRPFFNYRLFLSALIVIVAICVCARAGICLVSIFALERALPNSNDSYVYTFRTKCVCIFLLCFSRRTASARCGKTLRIIFAPSWFVISKHSSVGKPNYSRVCCFCWCLFAVSRTTFTRMGSPNSGFGMELESTFELRMFHAPPGRQRKNCEFNLPDPSN